MSSAAVVPSLNFTRSEFLTLWVIIHLAGRNGPNFKLSATEAIQTLKMDFIGAPKLTVPEFKEALAGLDEKGLIDIQAAPNRGNHSIRFRRSEFLS